MRKLLVIAVSVFLLASVATAWAADAGRPFAPVQAGPVRAAADVAPWAPDRVLVQLTEQAYEMTSLAGPVEKAAGDGQLTGIASLDATMNELDVRGLRSAFPNVHRAADKSMAKSLGADRWFIAELGAGADVQAAVKRLASDPNVAFAEPDLVAYPHVIPDDPMHEDNWGHNNTAQLPEFDWGGTWSHTGDPVGTVGFDSNAQAAWNGSQGYGDPNVVIAIIDSGVDAGHPDLLQVAGYDFGDNDSNPDDDSAEPGHGTACAGVAAAIADNTAGADGVAGGCSIMPLKAASSDGSIYLSAVANAIYWAADNGADVISMSLGAATTSHLSTDGAITYAYNHGVTILASTGNENASQIGYPAYHALVIGVGAASPCGERKRSSSDSGEVNPGVNTDPNGYTCDGERWWGSNYGPITQDHQGAVDVIAPTILPTTDIQGSGGYASGDYSEFFNGTSCSSPYAAGVAALIKSANPSFTPSQVRAQLVGSAEDVVSVESGAGWDRYTGYGMVDAAAAVGAVIPPAVVADFEGDATSGCGTLTVNFTDLSTGTVDSWFWNFGDGLSSLAQNPSHTYSAPGVYDVSLQASGPEGSDSVTKFGYIVVGDLPVASFESTGPSPIIINVGDSLPFTDLSTGDPTSWAWDFGDGGTSTEQNPTHAFNVAGFFGVSLTVTNGCGSDTDTQANLVLVLATAPTADFSYDPASGDVPLEVTFTDLSTGSPTSWSWDFGDGGTSTEQNPVYTYTAAGVYDVELTVSNSGGVDTKTVTGAVTVTDPIVPVVAAFAISDTVGVAPLEVTFTDLSTGDPTSWAWTFGDGGTSTEQNPVYTYAAAGTYDVSLTATNAGGSDTETVTAAVTVTDPIVPVVAAFSASDTMGLAPIDITFTDESTGAPTAWAWDFGDGGTSTEQNPVYQYTAKGLFTVTLIASNEASADTLVMTDLIDIIGVSGVGDGMPAVFGLVGNYPNPFNPATTIVFSLEKAGHARLEVFDLSGRRVATLVDGSKSAGRHEIHWRPDDLASGVYFSRLVQGDEIDTQRLTLLK